MTKRRPPKRYQLLEVKDAPFTTDIPKDEERCLNIFPLCPEIRCEKRAHEKDQICRASKRHPYYSIFWQHEEVDRD